MPAFQYDKMNNSKYTQPDLINKQYLYHLDDRGTVCLSSQVGCTLNCSFCHTGTQALVRNLTAGEIIGQLMLVMDHLKDWPSGKNGRKVTNIVMTMLVTFLPFLPEGQSFK